MRVFCLCLLWLGFIEGRVMQQALREWELCVGGWKGGSFEVSAFVTSWTSTLKFPKPQVGLALGLTSKFYLHVLRLLDVKKIRAALHKVQGAAEKAELTQHVLERADWLIKLAENHISRRILTCSRHKPSFAIPVNSLFRVDPRTKIFKMDIVSFLVDIGIAEKLEGSMSFDVKKDLDEFIQQKSDILAARKTYPAVGLYNMTPHMKVPQAMFSGPFDEELIRQHSAKLLDALLEVKSFAYHRTHGGWYELCSIIFVPTWEVKESMNKKPDSVSILGDKVSKRFQNAMDEHIRAIIGTLSLPPIDILTVRPTLLLDWKDIGTAQRVKDSQFSTHLHIPEISHELFNTKAEILTEQIRDKLHDAVKPPICYLMKADPYLFAHLISQADVAPPDISSQTPRGKEDIHAILDLLWQPTIATLFLATVYLIAINFFLYQNLTKKTTSPLQSPPFSESELAQQSFSTDIHPLPPNFCVIGKPVQKLDKV